MKLYNEEFFNKLLENRELFQKGLDSFKNKKGHFYYCVKAEGRVLSDLVYKMANFGAWANLRFSKLTKQKQEKANLLVEYFRTVEKKISEQGWKVPYYLQKVNECLDALEEAGFEGEVE